MQSIITSMVIITRCCKNKNVLLRWRCVHNLRESHNISLCTERDELPPLDTPPRVKIYFHLPVIKVCFISPLPAAACVRWALIEGASRCRLWRILKPSSLTAVLIDLLSTHVAPAQWTSLSVIRSSGATGVGWICSNVPVVLCWRGGGGTFGIVCNAVVCKDMT